MKENSCSQGTSGRLFLSLHSFVIRLKPREDYKRENEDFERNGRPEVVSGWRVRILFLLIRTPRLEGVAIQKPFFSFSFLFFPTVHIQRRPEADVDGEEEGKEKKVRETPGGLAWARFPMLSFP